MNSVNRNFSENCRYDPASFQARMRNKRRNDTGVVPYGILIDLAGAIEASTYLQHPRIETHGNLAVFEADAHHVAGISAAWCFKKQWVISVIINVPAQRRSTLGCRRKAR